MQAITRWCGCGTALGFDILGHPTRMSEGCEMTELHEQHVITEALTIIDEALRHMSHRELVSTDEVADLLLDVRTLLSAKEAAASAN